MARYTGPKLRVQRRIGEDLFMKGPIRTNPQNNAKEPRDFPPGQHGQQMRRKMSNFGTQHREKQKLKFIYGVLERQFRRYFTIAASTKGNTGTELLRILERRLDNVVYRAGFAATRAQARQMVNHGAVQIKGRRLNIPSYQVCLDDVVQLKVKPERGKRIQEAHKQLKDLMKTEWLEADGKELKITIKRMPERSDVTFPVQEQLVVELYSK